MDSFLGKQYHFNEKQKQELLENVLERLEVAQTLKTQGKIVESEAIIADLKSWLENQINENEQSIREYSGSCENRPAFPKSGEVFVVGRKVKLGVIRESEKEKYLDISREYSFAKKYFEDEEFCETIWQEFLSEESFVCSIYEKETERFVGYCSIKNLSKEEWELAIELEPNERHKGYGSDALDIFMHEVNKLTSRRFFCARVAIDNHASQGLMKKVGGYPNGVRELFLHGEEIERFQAEHRDIITDEIRNVAEEFCMEAEEILGYVLEYRFDMERAG